MARLTLALVTSTAAAWYLPGIAVHDYEPGEQVWLKINSLTSPKTQIPYEYYKFNFCRPRKIVDVKENFGEFLSGDRIQNSPYKVFALEDTYCNVLCATKTGGVDKAAKFADLVADNYHHNWILDNLPAAAVSEAAGSTTTTYSKGIPVGYAKKGKTFVHNHVTLIIKYHATADGNARIVGLYAEPFSVKHKFADGAGWTYNPTKKQRAKGLKVGAKANDGARLATCDAYPMTARDAEYLGPQEYAAKSEVIFAYDVVWEPSDVAWASRWDVYLATGSAEAAAVHWFSVVNALIIVVTLGVVVAVVLVRSLRADLRRYSSAEEARALAGGDDDAPIDESGWKVVHGDAFRPPPCPGLLCALVASGVQLAAVGGVVFVFAYVGFLSPANRGSLVVALLAAYALFGGVAGYAAAVLYRALGGARWTATTAATAALFPGVCGAVCLALDAGLVAAGSSGAAPLLVLAELAALDAAVAVPLVFLGAAAGFARPPLEWPAAVARVARPVPPQPVALSLPVAAAVCGAVPFGAAFVELYFALDAIWMESYYYVFGFAAAAFGLLVAAAAECGALVSYYTLCAEDHRWMWKAFLAPAAAGLYVLGYAAWYYHAKLDGGGPLTLALYFGYMGLASLAVALVAGAAGFLASLCLARAIYAAIKFD